MSLKDKILAALLAIKNVGPRDSTLGICANVSQILEVENEVDEEAIEELLSDLFSDWPDKSHSTAYPIGNWTSQPSKLFWRFHDDRRSMWDPKTEYGAARWALLEHCINKLNQGEN